MSLAPSALGRTLDGAVDPKYRVVPSDERKGRVSAPRAVFTLGPALTGSPHGSCALARVATKMSASPSVPDVPGCPERVL